MHHGGRRRFRDTLTVDQLLADLSGDGSHHVLRSEVALKPRKRSFLTDEPLSGAALNCFVVNYFSPLGPNGAVT